MSIWEHVSRYIARGFKPMPMWGVNASGRCLCGGIAPGTRRPCNAGKHSKDEESWKSGRVYSPADFVEGDNVAIALGPWEPSRWLVCLDFDGVTGFPEAFNRMGSELPFTLSQKSPRGLHLFYSVPPFEPLGNWVDAFQTKWSERWSLDIRYARGRINVAPSRSAHGGYQWVSEADPVAPLPRAIIHRLLSDRRRRGLEVQTRWTREGKRP